jgi:hypothetical protein
MVGMPQTVTGTALSALATVIVQVRTGAKTATFAGKKQTARIGASGFNFTNGFTEVFEHLPAHCVHHFWMVKLQHRYAIDKLQAHAFHITPLLI